MRARLRTYFIAGLIVFLPVAITFSIIVWLFRIVDSFLGWALPPLIGWAFPGLGLALSIMVILVIGALATNVLGRRVVGFFERLMLRIPLARSIYSATKSISDSLFLHRRAAFRTPVLIEGPRRGGIYRLGFVTGEISGVPEGRAVSVFIVATPNPTTGFLVFVPEAEARPLDMSVEDALKIVISGGIVATDLHIIPGRDPLRTAAGEDR
ncbi:MAG TPA: DUF502 domain-containing protein [bacterium]|nr:DUF502 domain-containing protein [bacterium]